MATGFFRRTRRRHSCQGGNADGADHGAGLVVFEHIGYNQRDQEVAYCVRTAFMKRKPA